MLKFNNIRYLLFRRVLQFGIMVLFIGSQYFGWQILKGNYSSALLFNTLHLTDPFACLQILISGVWIGTKALLGAAIVLVLYSVLFGRAFCSWVCPVNALNDLASFAGKKIEKNKNLTAFISRKTRYWVLALALALCLILQIPAFEMVSPIGLFSRALIFGIGSSWAIITALFLIELAVVKNLWCGRICPLGAFYAITGKVRLLRVKHKVENCTECNKCFDVCPEVQVLSIVKVKSGTINSGECTNCGRCIEQCADNALTFGFKNFKK